MIGQTTQLNIARWVVLVLLVCMLVAYLPPAPEAGVPLPQPAPIGEAQAIAAAINRIEATDQGFRLRHPAHTAEFSAVGVTFTPSRGGPQWSWQLEQVSGLDVSTQPVQPLSPASGLVSYNRGALVEQYLAKGSSLEQQFVLHQPPSPGADLVIAGAIHSEGRFQVTAQGWEWRTSAGAVRLGQVRVYDANGRDIPAGMQVQAAATRIVVDGAALALAAYPVTVDPEIGADDFRISDMGSDTLYDASETAATYNPLTNQFLVVWRGDTNTHGVVDGENEIWGQLMDAATGLRVGEMFRISNMGPDGDPAYDAYTPAVAFNPNDNEYLVVWRGDDGTVNEEEIYGQRLSAEGVEIGADDFRISFMGPDGNTSYGAYYPDIAFSTVSGVYGVVWQGDTNTGGMVDEEFEIWGQAVRADGTLMGLNFQISLSGMPGDPSYKAFSPAVAYDSTNDNFLVVWSGKDFMPPAVDEREIYGEIISAATGATVKNNFLISRIGPNGSLSHEAFQPDAVFNPTTNQYLVVWYGDAVTNYEYEIWGRLLNAAGNEVGADFQISTSSAPGDPNIAAYHARVAYNSTANEYLVVWLSDAAQVGEYDVYAQRLSAAGAQVGADDFRLSHMGPDGDSSFEAMDPAVVYAGGPNQYLAVWAANDDTPPLVNNEFEIFGQRLDAAGAETGEDDFRISFMGADYQFDAQMPALAYNSLENQYLVVWWGDDTTDNEFEIWGQVINAATGEEIGTDFIISTTGAPGDITRTASMPDVAYSSSANQYLVVWQSDHSVNDEYEIYGHYIDGATGQPLGDDFRISHMGPDGNTNYIAANPRVAYNSTQHEFMVVWQSDHNNWGLVQGEYEIWAQRIGPAHGSGLVGPFMRVSNLGPDGNAAYDAFYPAIVYNSVHNRFLVAWHGDHNQGGCVDAAMEVWVQHLDPHGFEIGPEFRVSDMGACADPAYGARFPALAYNSTSDQILIVWEGLGNAGTPAPGEKEIYGRIINALSSEAVQPALILSRMGPAGNPAFEAMYPEAVYNPALDEYFVVWFGDDAADQEFQVFGLRLDADGKRIGYDLLDMFQFPLSAQASTACGPSCGSALPAVAYNPTGDDFLVVWLGAEDTLPLVKGETEIFGQRYAIYTDLALTGSVTPDPVQAGGLLEYYIKIDHYVGDINQKLTLEVTLPPGAVYRQSVSTNGACVGVFEHVTCLVDGIVLESSTSVFIKVSAPATPGEITATAVVTGANKDPDLSNNTLSLVTTVSSGGIFLPMITRAP